MSGCRHTGLPIEAPIIFVDLEDCDLCLTTAKGEAADIDGIAIGFMLAEFFALVRLMEATWQSTYLVVGGAWSHDWQEALKRAGWQGPEVSE